MDGFFLDGLLTKAMSENVIETFDYLFLGMGAANSLLLLKMHQHNLLTDKKIAIIEPNDKLVNDRNFCFWSNEEELLKLNLKDLIASKWQKIKVADREIQNIAPNYYYHVRGIDLYNKVREVHTELKFHYFSEIFSGKPNFIANSYEIVLSNYNLKANKVFDSRPPQFNIAKKNDSHLLQSFYGWEIKTQNAEFDTSSMVMMDFNISQNNYCQFMYVLPFTNNTALFEVTRFGKETITETEANAILTDYLSKFDFSYQLIDKEKGIIPMSSLEIDNEIYGDNWIVTGAKAGMIKPTTGYAFYNMAIDAEMQVQALISRESVIRESKRPRFKFYDNLLLKILDDTPQKGENIFRNLFNQIPIYNVFNFLSEKSSINQELKIFSKLPILVFLNAAFKELFHRFRNISPTYLAAFTTIVFIALFAVGLDLIPWTILGIGFLTVGLSHGALDYLTANVIKGKEQVIKFVMSYLIKASLLGLVWIVLPDLAFVGFIFFSAWHFGQADFKEWKQKQGINSLIWGMLVLCTILFYHIHETIAVLQHIKGLKIGLIKLKLSEIQLFNYRMIFSVFSIIYSVIYKSKRMLWTLSYLLLSSFIPLLASFGIYFILQHSVHGWSHLKTEYNLSSYRLWLKSLPFSLGGILIFLFFMIGDNNAYIGLFFIILSCISIPHIFYMHNFYSKFGRTTGKLHIPLSSELNGRQ